MTKDFLECINDEMLLKKKEIEDYTNILEEVQLQNMHNQVLGAHHVEHECVLRLRIKECTEDLYLIARRRINCRQTLMGITRCLDVYYPSYDPMLMDHEKIIFMDFILSQLSAIPFAVYSSTPPCVHNEI
jgi:hypothetical protein